jgi:putative ABC transport system permease protein
MKLLRQMYRLLLLAYPEDLRRELGPEMLRTFEDRMKRERTLKLALLEGVDLLATGVRERIAARNVHPRRRPPSRKRKASEMEIFFKDVRHAARSLVRSPSFSVVAVVSLSLGIGANAAIFSLVNAVSLKPMPVDAPEDLVAVYATRATESMPFVFSYPNYLDLSESGVFSDLVAFQGTNVSVQPLEPPGSEPEIAWCEVVTENYFSGLRVPAALGRTFVPEDAHHPVAVLSYDFWKSRFSGRVNVAGTALRINGQDFDVVGVAARGFTGAKFLGFTPELWVPLTMHEIVWPAESGARDDRLARREGSWLDVRGRLSRGMSLAEAEAALDAAGARLASEYPEANRDWRLHLYPAPGKTAPFFEVEIGKLVPVASTALLAIAGIVLFIACANVASLKLARTLARGRELALRLSLGATRTRLVRQIALESVLLALVAGVGGLFIGHLVLGAAIGLGPVLDFSVDYGAEMDWRVLAFTAAVTLVAALLSGIVPALGVARRELTPSLKEGLGGGARRRVSRRLIVVPQIALSLVALVAAGLFVQSFQNVRSSEPGFRTDGILLATINPELQRYDETRGLALFRSLEERLRALPGVDAVSVAFPLPLDAYTEADRIYPEGSDSPSATDREGTLVLESVVGDDYFETVSTPIVEGRVFSIEDDASSRPVAIVNQTLARRFWPDDDPIGKRFRSGPGEPPVTVVGVARDGKYLTLGEEPRPYLFVPIRQKYSSPMTIVVRSSAPPRALEASLRNEVKALDPTLPVYGVKTMEEFLSRSLAGARALALATSFFAVLAAALATVGVYGLMSFSVSQRRHDLGVRMALGASRKNVLSLFFLEAARTVGAGIALGLLLAWASTRFLASLLVGVDTANVFVFVGVGVFVGLAALAGSFVPSRRATRLDPLSVLRHD